MRTEAHPSLSLIPAPVQPSSPITDAHGYDVLSESLIPLASYYLLIPAVSMRHRFLQDASPDSPIHPLEALLAYPTNVGPDQQLGAEQGF